MIINTHVEKKIKRDFFFIEGFLNIDSSYFIKKIKIGCLQKNNMSNKTNIKGGMTSWNYFNSDKKFLNITNIFINYVDENIDLPKYGLKSSWGFSLETDNITKTHTHLPCMWSGVLYLNSHQQLLDYPEINKKVKPEKGKFVLFSSFLKHGCIENNSKKIKWGISFNFDYGDNF